MSDPEVSAAASTLGKRGRGRPKKLTDEQRAAAADRMRAVRTDRVSTGRPVEMTTEVGGRPQTIRALKVGTKGADSGVNPQPAKVSTGKPVAGRVSTGRPVA